MPHRLDEVAFLHVEATRGGEVIAVGIVRGGQELRLDATSERERRRLPDALADFVGDAPLGGHNITRFDLPLLAASPVGYEPGRRPVLDTLVLSMLADPGRPSHTLDKSSCAGVVPDPVDDARQARALSVDCRDAIGAIDPALGVLYAALLRRANHEGAAIFVEHAIGAEQSADADALLCTLPESASAQTWICARTRRVSARRKLRTSIARRPTCDSPRASSPARRPVISKLREGDPLDLDTSGRRVRLSSRGTKVAELSTAGQAEFDKRIARVAEAGGAIHARVHEVYRHLVREDGDVRDSTLVVLPTLFAVAPR